MRIRSGTIEATTQEEFFEVNPYIYNYNRISMNPFLAEDQEQEDTM